MRRHVKNFAKTALYSVGYYHAYRALKTPRDARLLVLMYHDILDDARVSDSTELDDESPSALEFEAHLRTITRHYPVLPLGEAVGRLRRGELVRDTVSITFDDGYESVYSIAFPILKRNGISATVFLLTDWIEDRNPYWWPRVRTLIQHSSFATVTPHEVEQAATAPCGLSPRSAPDVPTRRLLAHAIEQRFRVLPDADRDRRIGELERLLFPRGTAPPAAPRAVTWKQVREMSAAGIEFEPHTRSHIDIRTETPDRIRSELSSSRREVEERTGRQPGGFAYPYGKEIDAYVRIEGVLREQGFVYAITARKGVNTRDTNPYLLWRDCLPNTASKPLIHRSLILAFARPPSSATGPDSAREPVPVPRCG